MRLFKRKKAPKTWYWKDIDCYKYMRRPYSGTSLRYDSDEVITKLIDTVLFLEKQIVILREEAGESAKQTDMALLLKHLSLAFEDVDKVPAFRKVVKEAK